MQKKQLFWIALSLIIFLPIARYFDTAPEREKEEQESMLKLQNDQIQRDQEEQVKALQMEKQTLSDLQRKKTEIGIPLKQSMRELASFMVPGIFKEFYIDGDQYDNIKVYWKRNFYNRTEETHEIEDVRFSFKDISFGFGVDDDIRIWCPHEELCIVRGEERISELSMYPKKSHKVYDLLDSIEQQSKRAQILLMPINKEIARLTRQ